jgi:trk system potassium uptake protein TrkH
MGIPWYKRIVVLSPSQWMIFGFALIILIGAILLALPVSSRNGNGLNFLDALFTSTSAVCVTGLVVVDTGQYFTHFGQIVILSLIQIGGLGFMTYGVIIAILLGKRLGLKQRLLIQSSTNSATFQGLVKLSLSIFLIALIFELVGSILLTLRFSSEYGLKSAIYYGIFHSVSAFNNAGFGLWSDNLSRYVGDPTVNIVVTLLIIFGGLGFMVILDIFHKRKWKPLTIHSKIVILTTISLIVIGTILIFIIEMLSPAIFSQLTWSERIWAAYFQSVSPRTAGFNTIDVAKMMTASQFFVIILMFIGASSGSTGGGVKTNTFTIVLLGVISSIRGKDEVHVFNRKIANSAVLRALSIIIIALGLVLLVSFVLTITESKLNPSFISILYETTSAFGTTGLSLGLTPNLTSIGKIIILLTMFIGRLGPLTLVYALSQNKKTSKIGYAEEKVLIG